MDRFLSDASERGVKFVCLLLLLLRVAAVAAVASARGIGWRVMSGLHK